MCFRMIGHRLLHATILHLLHHICAYGVCAIKGLLLQLGRRDVYLCRETFYLLTSRIDCPWDLRRSSTVFSRAHRFPLAMSNLHENAQLEEIRILSSGPVSRRFHFRQSVRPISTLFWFGNQHKTVYRVPPHKP